MSVSLVRVLVVEDFEPFRRFVTSTLKKNPKLQIIGEVQDGLEAVRSAEELKPELIILDIGLPKLNGIEAARQIRQLAPKSKILFLSQHDSPEIAAEGLSAGASGYVVKSDAGNELLAAIEAIIQGKRFLSARLACHDLAYQFTDTTMPKVRAVAR